METSFSNRLFLLPLFQGFSRLDFLDIVEKTPMDFSTLSPKEILVHQNDACESLLMVLSGDLEIEVNSPDHTYTFSETLTGPWIIQPERLFGLHNSYTCTISALSEVKTVALKKQDVRQLLTKYPVFQINFYNLVSTVAQHSSDYLWIARTESLRGHFAHFIKQRSLRPTGPKSLHIRMEDLAQELYSTRKTVSDLLADLAKDKLIYYTRGIIYIDALERL